MDNVEVKNGTEHILEETTVMIEKEAHLENQESSEKTEDNIEN